jgi:glycosyltransferase involved in cell wall biosynthesis
MPSGCTARPHTIKAMVLLLGNYPPDQQQSMQRFGAMMLRGLTARGIAAEIVKPEPVFGKFRALGKFVAKWLGYIDKHILFPFQLRKKLSASPAIVHICDHSNAVYVRNCLPIPVVVTCHDLLAVRGALGEQTDCPASFTGRFLQKWILRGLQSADAVPCDSEATEADAQRLLRQHDDRPILGVISLGLNYDYKPLPRDVARSRLKGVDSLDPQVSFVIHVGSNLRRKNRDGVLRIFARVKDKWNGRLVFAGEALTPDLRSLAAELEVADRVVEITNPSNELLEALYSCATALLYPSRFEGFGWPVIEAQACGCPVICSTSGPIPEAAGDAGLFHPVEDEAGFAADLLKLAEPEERAAWSEKSLRNAQRFSTEKMISDYTELYRRLGAEL